MHNQIFKPLLISLRNRMEYSDILNQVYQFFTKCSGSQEKVIVRIHSASHNYDYYEFWSLNLLPLPHRFPEVVLLRRATVWQLNLVATPLRPPLNRAGGDIITLPWSPNRPQRAERTNQSRWISLLPSPNAHRMTSMGTKYRRKSICCPYATYSLLVLVKANITNIIIIIIIIIIHTLKFDAIVPTGCCQHI